MYKVEATSWDAAGNESETAVHEIERVQEEVASTLIQSEHIGHVELNMHRNAFGRITISEPSGRSSVPAPKLYYAENTGDNTYKIHAKGVSSNTLLKVKISYAHSCNLGFFNCQTGYEEFFTIVDKAEWVAYHNSSPIGKGWNDSSDGKFSFGVNMLSGTVSARSIIYGSTRVTLPEIGTIILSYNNRTSQLSNILDVFASSIVHDFQQLFSQYNVSLDQQNGASWTEYDIDTVRFALNRLENSYMYANSRIILTQGDLCATGERDAYIYPSQPDIIYLCVAGRKALFTQYAGGLLHEYAHRRQAQLTGGNLDIANNSSNTVYQYHDILFNSDGNQWKLDTQLVNNVSADMCTSYQDGSTEASKDNLPVFVSEYACTNSLANPAKPSEEMAESFRVYIMDDRYLIRKDQSNNLHFRRYNYFNNSF